MPYRGQVWDLKTYKIKTDLPGHTDEVYCVDFVADKIVSGGRDRTVKMYVFFYWLKISLLAPDTHCTFTDGRTELQVVLDDASLVITNANTYCRVRS